MGLQRTTAIGIFESGPWLLLVGYLTHKALVVVAQRASKINRDKIKLGILAFTINISLKIITAL